MNFWVVVEAVVEFVNLKRRFIHCKYGTGLSAVMKEESDQYVQLQLQML
eukprot:CAMPEP_0170101812 /NCGR_PEP_ID=MMETSP0020_2-20130122/2481_1 /TAXON_ID=98059 /ORGANISM="Dinobryon sp., Strain UTEXLB2267" /LENGTH=48 /DNA_ID= /DNA_START= /DNA_END= /DNA_ORIENTATION=